MLLQIHPIDPQLREIRKVVDNIKDGGIIICPTDTIYGIGCDIHNKEAFMKICRIKGINPSKARFSLICYDLKDMSAYTGPISNPLFRKMKQYLPGPYTFIIKASRLVPKMLITKQHTIGIRVPDNNIARMIVKQLGNPLLSTSILGDMVEEYTDPELIHEKFEKLVDIVIDGGFGSSIPSTIIDCTIEPPEVTRQGLGHWE